MDAKMVNGALPQPPLVAHLIYRLDIGGLETLLVDTINRMPAGRYRHAVICLTDYTDFAQRITRPDVELFALHKPAGLALGTHADLFRLLRRLRPDILHTYNLGTIEYAATAWAAGVPVRVHAEHGRDARDPQGVNPKHNLLRRLVLPFIDRYVPVSHELRGWLERVVRIPARKIQLIDNGVDTERFRPGVAGPLEAWQSDPDAFVIGTVGRLQDVKDHATLVEAFVQLRALLPQAKLRLVLVGDGPLRGQLEAQVRERALEDSVCFAGARSDVAPVMRSFSLFALSSIAEGTPVTLLEAMASGLPVVATAVGGIPDLVEQGVSGTLAPARDPQALAAAIASYVMDRALAQRHGAAGRARIEQQYSMQAMLAAYVALYDELCQTKTTPRNKAITPCAE
ncbi:TIGR03088 family PEP-CTERM/XrtA system glycosyltransferase [Massilia sp. IC2-476]|uniref:TIGR03088 family PEP-CTERM/XrtA system glycosyltransferase n=1 Tax=Massilia sp. IC2-476 TaxID=2887199 RepID=UPI001D10E392|nr:TIGR03088 family PEP-CTERM/XrtA system glycosyltransferase [Massilia sp. IC2-476]MCC2973051.1 TIGR03088 family PEP-CTERM/XrtA system glycosyltransferase [Massilia sp. IC2-476]